MLILAKHSIYLLKAKMSEYETCVNKDKISLILQTSFDSTLKLDYSKLAFEQSAPVGTIGYSSVSL